MADTATNRRNWLVALGAAVLLLILLALMLSFCDSPNDNNTAGPATTASHETLPPVSASPPPGTLSPRATGEADNPPADPVATTASPTKKPKASASTKRTPSGGVDAGGGAGLTGRRTSLLVTGAFLLVAALVTARFAVGRTTR